MDFSKIEEESIQKEYDSIKQNLQLKSKNEAVSANVARLPENYAKNRLEYNLMFIFNSRNQFRIF